jgi:hypothetical protein
MNRRIAKLALLLASLAALAAGGCAHRDRDGLDAPRSSAAPYDAAAGPVVWAVAPLRNESGTLDADPEAITDAVATAIGEIKGVRALPLNRTLEVMRALEMPEVRSPAEARKLAAALGADALIVGSITSYDPYDPQLGLTLALVARPGVMTGGTAPRLNARELSLAATSRATRADLSAPDGPVASTSEHLDAKNHQVLMAVRSYAQGRSQSEGALGWKRYVQSMPLFIEFAAHHSVGKLVESEWVRVSRLPVSAQPTSAQASSGAASPRTASAGGGER